jgi:hypothetical protein
MKMAHARWRIEMDYRQLKDEHSGWIASRAGVGWAGITMLPSSRWRVPSCVLSKRALKKI